VLELGIRFRVGVMLGSFGDAYGTKRLNTKRLGYTKCLEALRLPDIYRWPCCRAFSLTCMDERAAPRQSITGDWYQLVLDRTYETDSPSRVRYAGVLSC